MPQGYGTDFGQAADAKLIKPAIAAIGAGEFGDRRASSWDCFRVLRGHSLAEGEHRVGVTHLREVGGVRAARHGGREVRLQINLESIGNVAGDDHSRGGSGTTDCRRRSGPPRSAPGRLLHRPTSSTSTSFSWRLQRLAQPGLCIAAASLRWNATCSRRRDCGPGARGLPQAGSPDHQQVPSSFESIRGSCSCFGSSQKNGSVRPIAPLSTGVDTFTLTRPLETSSSALAMPQATKRMACRGCFREM